MERTDQNEKPANSIYWNLMQHLPDASLSVGTRKSVDRDIELGPFIRRPDCLSHRSKSVLAKRSHSIDAAEMEEKKTRLEAGGVAEDDGNRMGRVASLGFKVSVPIHLCARASVTESSFIFVYGNQCLPHRHHGCPQRLVTSRWTGFLVSRRNTVTT